MFDPRTNGKTMTANVRLELSESGKLLRIVVPENGRLVAEILVHGPLSQALQNCLENAPVLKGRPNVFRGDLWGLAGYELLDTENEIIREK